MKILILQIVILYSIISWSSSLTLECDKNISSIISCQFGLPSVISDDANSFFEKYSNTSLNLNDSVLTCHYGSPNTIQQTVRGVFLREYRTEHNTQYFRHPSWTSIEFLDIHSCTDFYLLLSDQFSSLKQLKFLGIHYNGVGFNIARRAFEGLDSLEVLDLSDCRHFLLNDPIKYPFLLNALSEKGILPQLAKLNLENTGVFDSRPMKADSGVFRMIRERNIKEIKLRGQTLVLEFRFHDIWTAQPYTPLPVLSLQASMIILVSADTGTKENEWRRVPTWDVLQNFQRLTLSDVDLDRTGSHDHKLDILHSLCRQNSSGDTFIMTLFLFLVEINAERIKGLYNERLETFRVDASACSIMRLKRVRINQSGIRKLNLSMTVPDNKHLSEIDLSDNGMGYFFINGNVQSRSLILRNNSLQDMNGYTEFSQLLISFTVLEYLDFSSNGLRSLPRDIFKMNTNLKVILMNDNKLISLPFLMTHLKSLQLLKLRNNRLKSLDQLTMNAVEKLINGFHTIVDVSENPFVCSCRTATFIRWLPRILNYSQDCTCSMEGRIVAITKNTFYSCRYLCYRDIVYICVVIGCFLFVLLVTILSVRKYKAFRAKEFEKYKQDFIEKFAQGNLFISLSNEQPEEDEPIYIPENQRIEYIVMLAYHTDDYEICTTDIYEPLNAGLASLMRIDQKLVLFGLDQENPGVSLHMEMERCTRICSVFMCVVTRSFCEDHWCQILLENADREGKPIVFFLVEGLGDTFTHLMKTLSSRAFVIRLDDSDKSLRPSWETSCLTILNLAVKAHMKLQPKPRLSTYCKCKINDVCFHISRIFRKSSRYKLLEMHEDQLSTTHVSDDLSSSEGSNNTESYIGLSWPQQLPQV